MEHETGKPRISFNLTTQEATAPILDQEREKHKKRAERFGTNFVEPGKRPEMALEVKRERFRRPGFVTGIDLFSKEEDDKRAQRAARFATGDQAAAYQPDAEDAARRRRAKRFNSQFKATADTALMDVDLFEARREAAADEERRQDTIHVYGVDLLNTQEVFSYFAEYGPSFVEWINDSSCNVMFDDVNTAKRALAGLGKPIPSENTDAGSSIIEEMQYLWHKGKDFMKGATATPLVLRMATVKDVRDPRLPKNSRELWKSAPSQVGGKRSQAAALHDDDGDVHMRRTRGERAGKRIRKRQQRQNGDGEWVEDVDMADAEDGGGDDKDDEGPGEGAVKVEDLRQLISRVKEEAGPRFSAAAAGVVVVGKQEPGNDAPADGGAGVVSAPDGATTATTEVELALKAKAEAEELIEGLEEEDGDADLELLGAEEGS